MWVSHELQNTLDAHCSPQHLCMLSGVCIAIKTPLQRNRMSFIHSLKKILIGPLLRLRHCAGPWGGNGQTELAAFGMVLIREKLKNGENGT